MLVRSPELPRQLQNMAEAVMVAADDAAEVVRRLRNVSHIHERQWRDPDDLDRSQRR
jgi:hypothetical protein